MSITLNARFEMRDTEFVVIVQGFVKHASRHATTLHVKRDLREAKKEVACMSGCTR